MRPETPLSPAIRAYLAAFTRSLLAGKSTASDEERAVADHDRAVALDRLLDGAGIDLDAPDRREPQYEMALILHHSPKRDNLRRGGRKRKLRAA